MIKRATIRHFDEPYEWCSDLEITLKQQGFLATTVTDTARLKTYDKAWLWLCQALRIDCDILLHIDCDCVVRNEIDLSCLDNEAATVLAGPAIGSPLADKIGKDIAFSTGCMVLNRLARLKLLLYLETHKPTFCVYGRYGQFRLPSDTQQPCQLVASVDTSFCRLCKELGIAIVLDDLIVWRHRWTETEFVNATNSKATVIANIRGQHGN